MNPYTYFLSPVATEGCSMVSGVDPRSFHPRDTITNMERPYYLKDNGT